jgi:hypothetical protein
MKNFLLLFVIATCIVSSEANAQSMGTSYKTALGVKVWDGAGVSLKTFLNSPNALEFIGYFYRNGTRITGLYEIHFDINGAPGLKWYIGPGAHVGFYNTKYGGGSVVGIDGVLGLDYKVRNAPLNFSIDWQPAIEFSDGRGFNGSWGGLGIRYTF